MQAAEQLSFIPEVNEKEVRNSVIKELKPYRSLKIQAENRKEQREKGVIGLFPQLRKSTEYNELKVKQMDRALKHCLDQDEYSIIEKKYLSPEKIKDLEIMIELGLKRDKFYQVKRQAIYKHRDSARNNLRAVFLFLNSSNGGAAKQ